MLFPDEVRLQIISIDEDVDRLVISVALNLTAPVSPTLPPHHRQIILTDEFLTISTPKDPMVLRFRFVKKVGLSGVMVLTVRKSDWKEVQTKIAGRIGYLPLMYKGNSEAFWTTRNLAHIQVTSRDRQVIREKNSLFQQLLTLKNLMVLGSSLSDFDCEQWLQQTIDKTVPILKISGTYKLDISDTVYQIDYVKLLEAETVVMAHEPSTTFRWLDFV